MPGMQEADVYNLRCCFIYFFFVQRSYLVTENLDQFNLTDIFDLVDLFYEDCKHKKERNGSAEVFSTHRGNRDTSLNFDNDIDDSFDVLLSQLPDEEYPSGKTTASAPPEVVEGNPSLKYLLEKSEAGLCLLLAMEAPEFFQVPLTPSKRDKPCLYYTFFS